jgi:hypothetical protein
MAENLLDPLLQRVQLVLRLYDQRHRAGSVMAILELAEHPVTPVIIALACCLQNF